MWILRILAARHHIWDRDFVQRLSLLRGVMLHWSGCNSVRRLRKGTSVVSRSVHTEFALRMIAKCLISKVMANV